MRKSSVYGVVAVSILALSGCSMSPDQLGNPPMNQIKKVYQKSLSHNANLRKHDAVPASIEQALMPSLTLNNDKAALVAQRFDISVKNMPAQAFFMGLVKGTSYNMIVSPDVSGNITLNLKRVTIQQVLDAVHDIYGYRYEYTPYGFQVYPSGLQTRIFTVNYLDVSRTGSSHTVVSSGQITQEGDGDSDTGASTTVAAGAPTAASGLLSSLGASKTGAQAQQDIQALTQQQASSVNTQSQSHFWRTLQQTLKIIVGSGKGQKVIVNPGAGIVIVHAKPTVLKEVSEYLDSAQSSMNREVIIDAKIIEVTLDKGYQQGINWSILRASLKGEGLTKPEGSTPSSQPLSDLLGPFTSIFSVSAAAAGGNFSAMINLLSTQGNVQVLSSPRISTLNNQKAVIKVGSDSYYITNISGSNVADTGTDKSGQSTAISQDVEFQPFFSGIALGVTPQISADGSITLHVHPIVSKVTGAQVDFTVNGKDDKIPMATSEIRESDSIVRAKSGQVIVLGGLMQNKAGEQLGGAPGLDKIPFLGAAFRRVEQDSTRSELVILLRPIVVNDKTWNQRLKNLQALNNGMAEGYHLGSHPWRFGNQAETAYFRQNEQQADVAAGNKIVEQSTANKGH